MLRKLALPPLVLAVVLATIGWLYAVRAGEVPGPRIGEALPLDELARHSSAPLGWFVAVWTVAALLLAAAARWARVERLTAALAFTLGVNLLLYVATGTSLAITRQVPVRDALFAAGKLGAVYVPGAIVGLGVAALGRMVRRGRRGPVLVAAHH